MAISATRYFTGDEFYPRASTASDLADLSDPGGPDGPGGPADVLLWLRRGIELIQIACRQRRGNPPRPKVIGPNIGPVFPDDHVTPFAPVAGVAPVRLFVGQPLPEAFQ